jgi:hypothetical protein
LADLAKEEDSAFDEIQSVIQCIQSWLNDFYVYEMTDGTIRVEANYEGELEVDYSTNEVKADTY